MSAVVQELTHHGDFRHEREVVLPDLTEEAIVGVMLSAAYVYRDGPNVRKAAQDLIAGRTRYDGWVQHGWSNWRLA